jgi:hypothetical protein
LPLTNGTSERVSNTGLSAAYTKKLFTPVINTAVL